MSSPSLMDKVIQSFLAKAEAFSSRFKEMETSEYSSNICLMDSKYDHQWDPMKALSSFDRSQTYPNTVLNKVLGILDSNHNIKPRNLYTRDIFSVATPSCVSPYLFQLVNNLRLYRQRSTDLSLMSFSNNYLGNTMNSLFNEFCEKQKSKVCNSPVSELTMSLNIKNSPTKEMAAIDEKCSLSTNVMLNLKMADRKTKQMKKRSKKRRLRQKKSQRANAAISVTMSDDDNGDTCVSSSPSHFCFTSESPDFTTSVSFQPLQQLSPISSFVITVESDSNDDSEWETYDEMDFLNSSSDLDYDVLSCPISSPVKSAESKCDTPKNCGVEFTSSIISFVVPVADSSDDDSEWDFCESETPADISDFEFSGLTLENLCTPKTLASHPSISLTVDFEDEIYENIQRRNFLKEVNKNWNELTKGDDIQQKSTSKVSFAPDEDLVEVFPVEICDRKGEWEIYAVERLRFKRRIDEMEKILSPYLKPEHRSNVFNKLIKAEL